MHETPPFILASASPRRQEILHDLGYAFSTVPSCFDEADIPYCGDAERYCKLLSEAKGEEVAKRFSADTDLPSFILSSDTIVYSEKRDKVYGKPKSPNDAFKMLKELSGETHWVMTAVSLQNRFDETTLHTRLQKSAVTFGRFSDAILKHYSESGEPMDKAGGYAIQGHGLFLVKRIEGCLSTIIGLPIPETMQLLKDVKN